MRGFVFILVIAAITACSPGNKNVSAEIAGWETDIRNFEQLDTSELYTPGAILFTGSSSIRLWSTIKEDMAPYEVIQRGYGGAKLSDFVFYAERIIAPHPCEAIVLFIANDITGNEDDKRPGQVASLFSQLLKIIRKSHPGTPVFWIEVTPTPSRWQAWKKVSRASKLIRKACTERNNAYFISTREAFLDENGLPDSRFFMPDMLHLNDAGYRLWSGIIKNQLLENGISE